MLMLFITMTQRLFLFLGPVPFLPVFPRTPCALGKGMIILPGIAMLKGRLRLPLGLVGLGARGLPTFPLLVPFVGTRRGELEHGKPFTPAKTASLLPSGRRLPMQLAVP